MVCPMVASSSAGRVASRPRVGGGSLALWSLICVLGLVSLVVLDLGYPTEALSLGLALSATAIAWLFAMAYRASGNAFDPTCLAAVYLFLLFPFHGLVTQGSLEQLVVLGTDAERWLLYASLVQVASVPPFWLAVRSRASERLTARLWSPRFVLDDAATATLVKLFIVWVIAMAARSLLVAGGLALHLSQASEQSEDFQSFQFVLTEFGKLPAFVSAYVLVVGLREKRRGLVLGGVALVLVEVAWGFFTGSRGKVVFPLVTVVGAITYAYRVVRPRVLVAGLAVFTLVVLPFSSAFREAYNGRVDDVRRDGVELSTVTDSLIDASNRDAALDVGDGPLEQLAGRMHSLSSLALVMRFTPERRDYGYGSSLLNLPAAVLIPRAIWADKPQVSEFTEDFRHLYWGVLPDDQTSVAPSQLGHLWSELHIAGVLLGTLLFGLVWGVVFVRSRYGTVGETIFPQVVVASLVPYSMQAFEVPLDGWLAGLPKVLFIYVLVAWFLSSRRAPRERSAPRAASARAR